MLLHKTLYNVEREPIPWCDYIEFKLQAVKPVKYSKTLCATMPFITKPCTTKWWWKWDAHFRLLCQDCLLHRLYRITIVQHHRCGSHYYLHLNSLKRTPRYKNNSNDTLLSACLAELPVSSGLASVHMQNQPFFFHHCSVYLCYVSLYALW